uniref:SAP domain-containing protein n=1 Tax=Gongylonema pulchrum TaxID=637853 RepID=A0A183EZE8_9BILA
LCFFFSAPSVAEQQQQQQQQQPAAPTVDVKVLLAKLQRTGFLSSLKASNKGSEAGATDDSTTRPVTPPIPSVHRYEVTEKLPTPPTDLKSFSMRALKM